MKKVAVTLLALTAAGAAGAQTPAAPASTAPAFEAADVRAYKPQAGAAGIHGIIVRNGVLTNYSQMAGQRMQPGEPVYAPNGTVTMRSVTLRELISQAYNEVLRPEYLIGGPAWADNDKFELIAKAPAGATIDTEKLMLQALLAERFHLRVKRQQSPMPVFVLTTGRKERRLAGTAGGESDCKSKYEASDGRVHVTCTNMAMDGLANRLPKLEPFGVNLPAVNRTGVAGAYDFAMEWTAPGPDPAPAGISVFDAIEKLGLKLEQRKEPITVIVMERVEKPDAN